MQPKHSYLGVCWKWLMSQNGMIHSNQQTRPCICESWSKHKAQRYLSIGKKFTMLSSLNELA